MRFSHVLVFFDSCNVQKCVTQIIYLGPLPTDPIALQQAGQYLRLHTLHLLPSMPYLGCWRSFSGFCLTAPRQNYGERREVPSLAVRQTSKHSKKFRRCFVVSLESGNLLQVGPVATPSSHRQMISKARR